MESPLIGMISLMVGDRVFSDTRTSERIRHKQTTDTVAAPNRSQCSSLSKEKLILDLRCLGCRDVSVLLGCEGVGRCMVGDSFRIQSLLRVGERSRGIAMGQSLVSQSLPSGAVLCLFILKRLVDCAQRSPSCITVVGCSVDRWRHLAAGDDTEMQWR